MFKEIVTNRLFIGAFALFILCVVGFLLYMQHIEQAGALKLAQTEERVKQLTEASSDPIGKESTIGIFAVDDTSQGGNGHDNEVFDIQPPTKGVPSSQEKTDKYSRSGSEPATKAEYDAWRARYKADMGVYPPPSGYYHWKDDDGVHLAKNGAPYVKIKTYRGFRPSPAQLKTYRDLLNQKVDAWQKGNRVEYDRIVNKIEEIRSSSPGEIPNIGGAAFIGIDPDIANAKAQEILKAAFEELGIGYLYGVPGLIPALEVQPSLSAPFPEPK